LSQSLYLKIPAPSPLAGLVLMGSTVEGPRMIDEINPFRYVSSVATNNPETFDLWVDVIVGSKTNRVCNWSDKPLNLP
jgi:hypothetical protein